MRRTLTSCLAIAALVTAACTSAPTAGDGVTPTLTQAPPAAETFAAQVATTDLYAGLPQRVQIGVFSSTDGEGVRLLTAGEIDVTLRPAEGGTGTAVESTARYVPAPGTSDTGGPPVLTSPDVGRGVYQIDSVTLDEPGIWEAAISFVLGGEPIGLTSTFPVADEPLMPAPGQPALRTRNLTNGSDVPAEALDSRARGGAAVPDPELHEWTIERAIAEEIPALVLFATPVYCQSQFCGPTADALAELAATGPKDVAYIHIEIWRDYASSKVNEAAAEWLLREGDLTEPWLYLIGSDGMIIDRWGPLFDPAEVAAALYSAPAA
jgi:hypothetical protein